MARTRGGFELSDRRHGVRLSAADRVGLESESCLNLPGEQENLAATFLLGRSLLAECLGAKAESKQSPELPCLVSLRC